MKRSLVFCLMNIVASCLSSVLIWCLTERDFIANIVIVGVVIITVLGMLAHYNSRVHIIKEELKESPNK